MRFGTAEVTGCTLGRAWEVTAIMDRVANESPEIDVARGVTMTAPLACETGPAGATCDLQGTMHRTHEGRWKGKRLRWGD